MLFLNAGIAQLVERNLAKVEVASSRLVSRSRISGKAKLRRRVTFRLAAAKTPKDSLSLFCLKVSSAGWQSGHAAACKAVYAGSIPTPASRFYCGSMAADAGDRNVSSDSVEDWLQGPAKGQDVGRVVELGYTRHLKCLGASHTGSSPVSPTKLTGIEVSHDRI